MNQLNKIFNSLSSLKVAIVLLILIAIGSALGTTIPQNESYQTYLTTYGEIPWMSFLNGEAIVFLQLDHVYTSFWFLFLLTWLGVSLVSCSWRRQWPMLQSALRWVDYKSESQIKKLTLSKVIKTTNSNLVLDKLTSKLKNKGWKVQERDNRIAARKGVIGRVGPLLVHLGLIILMLGATYGSLNGQKVERFLAPGKSIDLLNANKDSKLNIYLNDFEIIRDPQGRPEQFKSQIKLTGSNMEPQLKEISVNHPLRFNGITIYQADWELAAITIQINESPKLQLPIVSLPQIGDEIWGVVIPTNKDNSGNNILLTVSNENGPINIFNEAGEKTGIIMPNGKSQSINDVSIKAINIIPSSGLLMKYDPGVPFVYIGFSIILIGGSLSIISTKQIWAISDKELSLLHVGGISNRNLSGFSRELPNLLSFISDP